MYKSVYDLSPAQLDELKAAFFWSDDPDIAELLEEAGIVDPADIPDDIIFHHHEDVCFVDDDFSCSSSTGTGSLPHTLPF